MLVPGTSRPRSVLCGPTSSASIVDATTRATATRTSSLWTTVCKVSWDSGWTCPRTSKWITTFGWSGRSSPNLFPGKNCYSENLNDFYQQQKFQSGVQTTVQQTNSALSSMSHVLYRLKLTDGFNSLNLPRCRFSIITFYSSVYVTNYWDFPTLMPPTVFLMKQLTNHSVLNLTPRGLKLNPYLYIYRYLLCVPLTC